MRSAVSSPDPIEYTTRFITLFRDEVRTTKLQSMETGVLKLKTDEDDSQEIDFVWARFGERKSISDVEIAVVAPVTAGERLCLLPT